MGTTLSTVADLAREEGQRREHGHGGQERGDDPRRDHAHAVHGGVEDALPLAQLRRDVLREDDGVVHHQAERHQQGHHGEHVDRHAEERHEEERAQEGDGQTHGDPEGVAEAEEEPHGEEHEEETLQAVA